MSGGNICVAAASVRQLHVCGSSKRAAVFDINQHGQKQALCSSVWKQAAQHYTTCCSVMRVGTSVVRASVWLACIRTVHPVCISSKREGTASVLKWMSNNRRADQCNVCHISKRCASERGDGSKPEAAEWHGRRERNKAASV